MLARLLAYLAPSCFFLSFPRCEVLIATTAAHASGITANQISYLHGLLRGIADRIGSSFGPIRKTAYTAYRDIPAIATL
ncbi:hypothetical protein GGI35DRAFT_171577 [Trichoderma velutinum]